MNVSFRNVGKQYGSVHAVRDLNLDIAKGALHFILGPSGCGKTTTLRMLAGLEKVTSGKIYFNGDNVTKLSASNRGIGMVFQNYALWPHMTVFDNVAYGLRVKGFSKKDLTRRVGKALEITQLGHLGERFPGQLSGGQQQRVALARALAVKPKVLLLDEPLSNLDTKLRLEMRDNIARIHRQTGITTIYVTHDQKESLSMGTHITVMNNGCEIQTGTPREVYTQPVSAFLASFIGETNLVEGHLDLNNTHPTITTAIGTFTAEVAPKEINHGDKILLSLRPEAFRIAFKEEKVAEHTNHFSPTLANTTYLGEFEQMDLDFGSSFNFIRANLFNSPDHHSTPGDRVYCSIRPRDVTVLPYEEGLIREERKEDEDALPTD